MKDCITLFDKQFVPFIKGSVIEDAIARLAERLNLDYKDTKEPIVLLCVLNGSIMFTAQLMKDIDFLAELMTIRLASYNGTQSEGSIKILSQLTGSVKGRKVLICEDIVDTGTTITYLTQKLLDEGAAEVKVCTMLLKPEVYKQSLKIDYVAMEVPNRFILGYGLDYDQLGRNLKDIYVLKD